MTERQHRPLPTSLELIAHARCLGVEHAPMWSLTADRRTDAERQLQAEVDAEFEAFLARRPDLQNVYGIPLLEAYEDEFIHERPVMDRISAAVRTAAEGRRSSDGE